MSAHLLAAAVAVAAWWGATVVVLRLDHLPRGPHRLALGASCLLAIAAFIGVGWSARLPTAAGAYLGFACGVVLWGWHEMSFYRGWITGPRPRPAPEGVHGLARLGHAVMAVLWHELALAACAAGLAAACWGTPNPAGLGVFLLLWIMHTSAKLNVFLGVRNLQEAFLPEHMAWVRSHLRRRAGNALLPASLAGGALAAAWLSQQAWAPGTDTAGAARDTLLLAFLVLALVEHVLLVLPFDPVRLFAAGLGRGANRGAQAAPPAAPILSRPA